MKNQLSTTRKRLKMYNVFSKNCKLYIVHCKLNKGFTIIELIVVIAIGMVIGSLSLAAYNTFSRKQEVDQAALQLQSVFDQARFSALSNVKPPQCGATYQSSRQFIVELIGPSPASYKIKAICILSAGGESTIDVKAYTFPKVVKFGTMGCGTYYYESITNKFYCGAAPGAPLPGNNTVTLTNGSDTRTLTITKNGKVTVN